VLATQLHAIAAEERSFFKSLDAARKAWAC